MNGFIVALIMLSAIIVAAAPAAKNMKAAAPAKTPTPPPLSKYWQGVRERFQSSAPGDRYFGKMKMSFLGINNTFRDATISAGTHTVDPQIVNKVALADDALRDWARKFPHDPQLARSYFLAVQIDKKIWLKPNQDEAWVYMHRIVDLFPASYFGKLVKRDLAVGFTEHYYAEARPCPTSPPTPIPSEAPTPSQTPTPAARRGRARATPTPEPTLPPTPEPTPTPSPEPTPIPTPRQIAKGLKVQIETPPCVAPQTPLPTPTPSVEPLLAPTPIASPSTPPSRPLVSPRPGMPTPAGRNQPR